MKRRNEIVIGIEKGEEIQAKGTKNIFNSNNKNHIGKCP